MLEGSPLLRRIEDEIKKAKAVEAEGRYYVLKNVEYKQYANMAGFVDIWILITSFKSREEIQMMERYQQQANSIEQHYITSTNTTQKVEFIEFKDIQHLLNGFSRMIWYYSTAKVNGQFMPIGQNNSNKVFQMREGETSSGWMNGYNRQIQTIYQKVKIGYFISELASKSQIGVTYIDGRLQAKAAWSQN